MPEFLIITNRQNVLDVVDQIKNEDKIEIQVESDFSKGLKAIFYRLPDVVFIQEEIAGITAEKVATQVRTLLDDEPIRLMLLHERLGEWDIGDPSFDGIIDTGLPFNDLVSRFREVLNARPVNSGATHAETVDEDSALGLKVQTDTRDTGFEFDPFSDIFPAQIHQNWGTFSPETGQEAPGNLESQPTEEPAIVDYEFSFETPGDIVSSMPLEKTESPDQDKGVPNADTKALDTSEVSRIEVAMQFVEKARPPEKELPNQLFASKNEEDTRLQIESEMPSRSMSEKLRLKGVVTQSSIIKSGTVEPALASSDHPRTETLTSADGEAVGKSTMQGTSAKPPPMERRLRDLKDNVDKTGTIRSFRKIPVYSLERNRLTRLLKSGSFLLVIGIATFLLIQNREYMTQIFTEKDESLKKPEIPHPAAVVDLPTFIPRVPPDSVYAANHPGWERYHSSGIDYLVYREKGRLLAIQIVALPEGKISETFIKMCIRESTGLVNVDNWTRQKHGDFIVDNSSLSDRGEIAVYRNIQDGEIRGIVITFK